jgi:hypothetical protein
MQTRNHFWSQLAVTMLTLVGFALVAAVPVANSQKPSVRSSAHSPSTKESLYSEYRGVRVGMKAQEVRVKLGEPLQKADDMDLYSFSEKETAQIAYDASHSVTTISVDYLGGVGAPDYKDVVGSDVEVKADGSIYKVMRYDSLGFWVFYNRGQGENAIVTITIQKKLG